MLKFLHKFKVFKYGAYIVVAVLLFNLQDDDAKSDEDQNCPDQFCSKSHSNMIQIRMNDIF